MKHALETILPAYPHTLHLPWKPNVSEGDHVATEEQAAAVFTSRFPVYVEEKLDGASCGMAFVDGHPMIRSRDHILRKGYRKETPAKMQFASVWTWFYDHVEMFERLQEAFGLGSVYGEWMYAQHGIYYDRLTSLFYAYEIYDHHHQKFLGPTSSRALLESAGFTMPPLLHRGKVFNFEFLEGLTQGQSLLSSEYRREGVYLKIDDDVDGVWTGHRFKMVRSDYVRGALWDKKQLKRNKVLRGAIECPP